MEQKQITGYGDKISYFILCLAVCVLISSLTNPFYGIIGTFAFNYGYKKIPDTPENEGDEE